MTMTATIQVDLRDSGIVEIVGEFLESMNVVGVTIASGGKTVRCTGLVMSLVPADPIDDTVEENDRLAEALYDLVGDHCPSHAELEPTCPTCSALILLRDREVR